MSSYGFPNLVCWYSFPKRKCVCDQVSMSLPCKYFVLNNCNLMEKFTQHTTCFQTTYIYHLFYHNIPLVLPQHTTCFTTTYHLFYHNIPLVLPQHTTCFTTTYHLLYHNIPLVLSQHTTCFTTTYHLFYHTIITTLE